MAAYLKQNLHLTEAEKRVRISMQQRTVTVMYVSKCSQGFKKIKQTNVQHALQQFT